MVRTVACLFLACATLAADPDPEAARKAVAEGDAARAKGDLAGAIEDYDRAVAADPASPAAWHHRGLARRQNGKFADAIADLDKAIDLDPAAPGAHNDLGLAKADAGDLAGAIASYDTALRLAPDSSLTWNNRSFARRLTGDVDGALKDATMALQLDPKYARAFLNRGLCLYDLREWEDALADLEKSVELEAAGQDFTNLRIWILRTRLGKSSVADKNLGEWLSHRKPGGDWIEKAGNYLLGKLDFMELWPGDAEGKTSKIRMTEFLFIAGSKEVATGHPERARKFFEGALLWGVKNTEVIRSVETELEPLRSSSSK